MISKHITCKPQNDDYGRLARYIADAGHKGEKTLLSWFSGCWTEDDYQLAIEEVETVQKTNVRTAKEKTYHLMVSLRPEDEDKLTPDVFREIELEFARVLGFEKHQRHAGVHKNTDNLHLHVAYNMIHPEHRTRHEPFRDFRERDRLCRQLEQKYGLTVDTGREPGRTKPATNETAKSYELHTGQESLFSYAQRHKEAITGDLAYSHSWADCHQAFFKHGLLLKPRGNGLVIQSLDGRLAIKASNLGRALSRNELEKKFGAFEAASNDLIKTNQPEHTYMADPVQLNPNRDNLYLEYKAALSKRRAEMETLKQENQQLFAALRETWDKNYENIKKLPMLRSHRQKVMKEFQAKKRSQLESLRQISRGKRGEVSNNYPFTTWNQFLCYRAGQGQESALAILRSRQREVQAEVSAKAENTGHNSSSSPKSLAIVAEMQKIWRQEAGGLSPPTDMKYTIDAKGTVIFTLPRGGSIRDNGPEIHFSPQDEKAKSLAQKLAQAKWGLTAELNGHILKRKPILETAANLVKSGGYSR